jgi:regulator of replication initiation timing
LKTTIVCLRRQIEDKQGAVSRLEILLRERLTRIDHLTAQVEQLRDQNRKLDVENELLAAMVQLPAAAALPTN